MVAASGPVLYITGEESAAQVRLRADRIGAVHDNLFLAAETDLDAIITHVSAVQPRLLIIDSVQTIAAGDVDGVPGGVTQVREVGGGADGRGQRQGQRPPSWSGTSPRTARWPGRAPWSTWSTWSCTSRGTGTHGCGWYGRSRTGSRPTDEATAAFDLGEYGLDRAPRTRAACSSPGIASRCLAPASRSALEGRRPLLAEVQALVGHSVLEVLHAGSPRGSTPHGSAWCLAVLQRRAEVKVGKSDRLRRHEGRRPAHRAVRGPGRGARHRELGGQPPSPSPGRHRGGRWVGLAWLRCETWPPCRAGWPRRSGWVSAFRRSSRPASSSGSTTGNGFMEVTEVEDVREALQGRLPRVRLLWILERADRARLAVAHRHRVERARFACRQRAATARWPDRPGDVPGQRRQHLRYEREPSWPWRLLPGAARRRVPRHAVRHGASRSPGPRRRRTTACTRRPWSRPRTR